jgi:hypothetical protein
MEGVLARPRDASPFRSSVTVSFRTSRWLRVAVLATPLLAACNRGDDPFGPQAPWEGEWRLVRIDGQPLPLRRDGREVTSETLTLLFTGSGFLRDEWRPVPAGGGAAGATVGCTAWFIFTLTGNEISTRPAANQQPQGECADGVETRRYTIDGDTLRATGGSGFQLGDLRRAYVRR